MPIQSRNLRMTPEQLAARTWDWTFLNDAFPRGKTGAKITVGDLDGMVEISGHFLFIEVKSATAKPPTGQRIALERLAMTSPYITVIYLFGHYPDTVVRWEILKMGTQGKLVTRMVTGTSKEFMQAVNNWHNYARQHPRKNLRRSRG